MNVQCRRDLTEKAISINPSQVQLTRKGKVSDGAGGWTENADILVPVQVFRIFISSGHKEVSQEGGTFQIKSWEMLCPWDANISKDDRFEDNYQKYRVVKITPIRYLGELISYQCVVEEVV